MEYAIWYESGKNSADCFFAMCEKIGAYLSTMWVRSFTYFFLYFYFLIPCHLHQSAKIPCREDLAFYDIFFIISMMIKEIFFSFLGHCQIFNSSVNVHLKCYITAVVPLI